jgi:hypothetical protein
VFTPSSARHAPASRTSYRWPPLFEMRCPLTRGGLARILPACPPVTLRSAMIGNQLLPRSGPGFLIRDGLALRPWQPSTSRLCSPRVLPNRHSTSHLKFRLRRVQTDQGVSSRIEHGSSGLGHAASGAASKPARPSPPISHRLSHRINWQMPPRPGRPRATGCAAPASQRPLAEPCHALFSSTPAGRHLVLMSPPRF